MKDLQTKVEWMVLRDGIVFSDRFNNEDECVKHIEECIDKENECQEEMFAGGPYNYTFREMTEKEIEYYEN